MRDDHFEWDDTKASGNYRKHGVAFAMARRIFDDSAAVFFDDNRENYGELRTNIIGLVDGNLLVVTFTERNERVRIISARQAAKNEREIYAKS